MQVSLQYDSWLLMSSHWFFHQLLPLPPPISLSMRHQLHLAPIEGMPPISKSLCNVEARVPFAQDSPSCCSHSTYPLQAQCVDI